MKKKNIPIILLVVIIIICTNGITISAANNSQKRYTDEKDVLTKEEEDEIKKAYDDSSKELQKLYQYIDELKTDNEMLNDLEPEEYIKKYITSGEGNIELDQIIDAVISLIFKEVSVVLKFGITIVAIAILCSLLKNLQDSFASKGISEIAFYACYTILIIVITKSFAISIEVAKNVITDITNFMNAILPVLVSMTALSGGIIEASTLDPIILSVVIVVPKIYKEVIIPLIMLFFVLEFVNNLSTEQKISNLCKMVKKIIMWLQGIVVTVSISIVTIRGLTSSTLDAVTLKTTKFAVDNFIPIVGKSFSDAITSVASYSLIIKNAVSTIGLLVIVLIILYPVIKIVLTIFIYKFCAAVIEPICDKRIVNAVSEIGECMVFLLSTVLTVSLMFFILLGIMSATSRFIVIS